MPRLSCALDRNAIMNPKNPPAAPSFSAWLQSARAPYLNFLRNLTPQVFLASLAWVMAAKLNFSRFDPSNFGQTFLFYAFLTLFAYAVYSNVTLFLSELFPTLTPWIEQQEQELKSTGTPKIDVPLLLLKAVMRERRLEVLLVLPSILLLQVVLAGVFASSIVSALSFIHATH